jgi:hypothetical protein
VYSSACGDAGVQVSRTPIPPITGMTGSFDDIEIDQGSHRLFVADRTDQGVDVFDISQAHPKYVQTIPMPASPNGLAIAPDLGRLFVGTSAGSVVIVDINSGSQTLDDVIGEVNTGGSEVDLLEYSAARGRLYASNGPDGSIASIDSATGEIKAHFKVGSTLEQPRFNPADGMVYVTSPDADALFRIDPAAGTVTSIPLGGCQPTGLAINPKSNRAMIACQTFALSWDLRAGKLDTFPQVVGGDVVSYDARADRFFVASAQGGGGGLVGIFEGDPITYVSSVATRAHGKSAAYDETNDAVYTPDAHPNGAGIAGFHLPATPPAWLTVATAIAPFAIALAVLGLLGYVVARSADPARRREPAVKPTTRSARGDPAEVRDRDDPGRGGKDHGLPSL